MRKPADSTVLILTLEYFPGQIHGVLQFRAFPLMLAVKSSEPGCSRCYRLWVP